jgi:hypothetical protein
MVNAFRYVVEDNLYTAYSELLRLQNGREVFEIICPDFNDKRLLIIETGIPGAPYQPAESIYINPFSEIITQWFSDYKLLSE